MDGCGCERLVDAAVEAGEDVKLARGAGGRECDVGRLEVCGGRAERVEREVVRHLVSAAVQRVQERRSALVGAGSVIGTS